MKFKLSLIALAIMAACSQKEYPNETIGIIPQPQVVNYTGEGRFNVAEAVVSCDSKFDDLSLSHIADFNNKLSYALHKNMVVEDLQGKGIRFVLDKNCKPEEYSIEVKKSASCCRTLTLA